MAKLKYSYFTDYYKDLIIKKYIYILNLTKKNQSLICLAIQMQKR